MISVSGGWIIGPGGYLMLSIVAVIARLISEPMNAISIIDKV